MKSWMKCGLLALLNITLVHCGGVSFAPGTAPTTAASNGGSSSTGQISQGTTGTTTTNTTTSSSGPSTTSPQPGLPQLTFVGPPCQRGTECEIEFQMSQPASETFQLTWQTNDTLYLQTPPAGEVYGEPGVQYVSTSGTVVFNPGDTVEQVYVQNINPQNTTVVIGILMTSCQYGGVSEPCVDFFQ